MIFAKAKTRAVRMMRAACAGQGSPGSLAFWVAPKHIATTKAVTGQEAERMDRPRTLPGVVFPVR